VDEREIAGAAAEVSNQDQLVAIERAAVLMRGGDRLELERDRLEPRRQERLLQTPDRVVVIVHR
jgi:hypothetical protein